MGVISMSPDQPQGKEAGTGDARAADARRERLSALMDGEPGNGEDLADALSRLSDDERATWSRYHLIGDVLRSDELALAPDRSAAMLEKFSARLQREPHLLAPAALPALVARPLAALRRVAPTLAVAASAAMLTWIVAPQHGLGGAQRAPGLAARDGAMQRVSLRSGAQGGNLIGDARLDAYLEAHQQFGQQPGMQDVAPYAPSAFLSSRVQEQ